MEERATKTEGVIKPIEQPVTDKDKNVTTTRQSEQKTTAKTNPTNAQTSLPRTGERIARGFTALVLHVYS